ncbi:7357_t:CDS:2 [Entrophospora sp. SA101]|nr:7357_t:CDS:2 [Entrophospora sp. SA101]
MPRPKKNNSTQEQSGFNNNEKYANNNDQQLPRSTSLPLINQLNNSQNQQRYWYDKLVDAIVGEDEQKYALICKDCYTWNGLAFAADYDDPSLSTNNNLLSSSNGNLDASIDSLSPRRGRSTTPKPTSRDSSSDPENKRLASRSTSRKRKGSHHRSSAENDDNEGFEDNRFKHYNVKDGIDDNNE